MRETDEDSWLEDAWNDSISGTGDYDQSEDVYAGSDSSDSDFWQEPDEPSDQ